MAGHKLSTYVGNAFDISADGAISVTSDNCKVARVCATHEEIYLLACDTVKWETAIRRFRAKIRRPAYDFKSQPELPPQTVHRNYEGGPLTQSLDDVVGGLTATWKNTDTTLQRKDLKGSIQIGLKVGLSKSTGTERTTESGAEITYAPGKKKIVPSGCYEVLSVGGTILDNPVTGMVVKEGCQ